MNGFLTRVAAERLGRGRPSSLRALGAALAAGAGTAVITYRLLRQ